MKAILSSILFLAIALAVAFSYSRGHHRNGYRKQKPRVRTVIRSESDRRIIGDGAWPRERRREPEPMGM